MNPCPAQETLRQLLAQQLSAAAEEAMVAHVQTCLGCQEALADLAESLPELLPGDLESRPAVPALTHVGTIVPAPVPRRSLPTGEEPGAFLAPAEGPGELGRLGTYRVLQVLGAGGMGVVFKAQQAGTRRLVALKMIRSGPQASAEEMARFRVEAETVARCQHPHIVQIHEVGEHQGQPFLALELVDGSNLAQRLASTPQAPREAAGLIETLARAIHYAHARGIVHRDLKPANILLTPDGVPKITDFGLAKQLDTEGSTQSGVLKGTPCYMAPEQARGEACNVDGRADLYALGSILYEMLTGRPPFKGTTVLETLEQVSTQEPVPPSQLQPGVPRDLETICLKCLQKDRHKRYASAEALADDLRRFLNGEPIQARPTPLAERLWKWSRRYPTAAVALAATLFGLVAATTASIFHARLETQRARIAQEQLEQRESIQNWWWEAEQHLAKENLAAAQGALDRAEGALAAQHQRDTADLQAAVQRTRAAVEQRLAQANQGKEAKARAARLLALQEEVRQHKVQPGSPDRAESRAKLCATARQALALYRWDQDPGPGCSQLEQDRAHLPAAEWGRLVEACYELLLFWAEAEPNPGQPPDQVQKQAEAGLALLERAHGLGQVYGLRTQAYFRFKSRLASQAGSEGLAVGPGDPEGPQQPTGALDWFLAGLDAYQAGQFDQARQCCQHVLARQEDHFWAQYVHALCQVQSQRWGEGKGELTGCLNRRPEFVWARLTRGHTASELGFRKTQLGEADAEREYASAAEDLNRALEQGKNDPLVQYVGLTNRGALHFRRDQIPEAIRDLTQAIQLLPTGYQAHANLAQALKRQQRWDEATTALGRAIELRPDLAELYHARAELYLKCRNRPAARTDFLKVIELEEGRDSKSDRFVRSLAALGELLHRQGQHAEALAQLDRALALRPSYTEMQWLRAQVLEALDRHQEACHALDLYLEKNRQPPAEVCRSCARIYTAAGQLPAAIVTYSMALRQQPDDLKSRCSRGWAYLLLNAASQALEDFEACLRQEPDNADALVGRGSVRIRQRQPAGALEDARAAEKKSPLNCHLMYHLACLYAQAAGQAETEGRTSSGSPLARLRPRFEEKAVAYLQRVLEEKQAKGQAEFWRRQIQADPALASLRRNPEYARLTRAFGSGVEVGPGR